jgi:malonate decarboxylase alpha subunit
LKGRPDAYAIVIVRVNEIVQKLPGVDIPSSWVDVVVEGDRPYAIEPLFPRIHGRSPIFIRGIYERHQVHSLNHESDSTQRR